MFNYLIKIEYDGTNYVGWQYQKTVRSDYSEYDFFKFIFSNLKIKKPRVLDLCCGDSFILNYIEKF